MIGLLAISYWLSRFVFFAMHGMKQWPTVLVLFAALVIVLASLFGSRTISAATVIGYLVGFMLAMIFNTDGADPGGGRTNNAWIIWAVVCICSILIGVVVEIVSKKSMKNLEN